MKRPSFCARSGDAGALARRQLLQGLLAVAATFGAAACRSPTTKHLRGEKVDAGCAMCLFGMQGVRACIWAVSIDGKPYLAEGNLPKHHDAHAPDGMCNVKRQAIVSGDLVNNKFIARTFDLMPAAHIPENPRFTPAHRH